MTGNTLTTNPISGTNAYANGAYGASQPGFWGNTGGVGGSTPFGFGTTAYQPQVMNPINMVNPFNQVTPFTPQIIQQPGFVAQTTTPWQTGYVSNPSFGFQGMQQGGLQGTLQSGLQGTTQQVLNTILQTTPAQVVNTILQTTPPQVLPYILNALACQQACQQVLAQNPQAVQGINPQTITQPFLGYGTTNQGQIGFGPVGYNTVPFVGGYASQALPLMQQSCVGCQPGMQQWTPTAAFQNGFNQVLPQQPWFNTTYGTW